MATHRRGSYFSSSRRSCKPVRPFSGCRDAWSHGLDSRSFARRGPPVVRGRTPCAEPTIRGEFVSPSSLSLSQTSAYGRSNLRTFSAPMSSKSVGR